MSTCQHVNLCGGITVEVKLCANPTCQGGRDFKNSTPTDRKDGCAWITCPNCTCNWCWCCGNYGNGTTGRPAPHHVHDKDCHAAPDAPWVAACRARYAKEGCGHIIDLATAPKYQVKTKEERATARKEGALGPAPKAEVIHEIFEGYNQKCDVCEMDIVGPRLECALFLNYCFVYYNIFIPSI